MTGLMMTESPIRIPVEIKNHLLSELRALRSNHKDKRVRGV